MSNEELLTTFVSAYPAQPATAYWRAIEIGALLQYGVPEGLGLDLGCGDGILTDIILKGSGPRRLVGVDPDPLETEAARKYGFYERVHTAPGDAIPEPDGVFDFVLANSVVEHIPDLEATIAETARVLRSGGKVIFTVPGPGFHNNLRGPIMPGVTRDAYLTSLDRRLLHLRYLSAAQWTAMFARHGLSFVEALGYLDARETRRWESLSRATGGLLYAVFGQKKRPIEIQRSLGLRAMQNQSRLPHAIASLVEKAICIGAPVDGNAGRWLAPESASCLLVVARK